MVDYEAGDLRIEGNSYHVQDKRRFLAYASMLAQDKAQCFDFDVQGLHISVKSTKSFGDLLLLETPNVIRELLIEKVRNIKWKYDFPGFIYYSELTKMIRDKRIIPKNAMLNGRTKMDADIRNL